MLEIISGSIVSLSLWFFPYQLYGIRWWFIGIVIFVVSRLRIKYTLYVLYTMSRRTTKWHKAAVMLEYLTQFEDIDLFLFFARFKELGLTMKLRISIKAFWYSGIRILIVSVIIYQVLYYLFF